MDDASSPPGTLALLGTGAMGSALVGHLRRHGWRLRLYNRTESRARTVAAGGDIVCSSPAEAAEGSDVILSLVSDDGAAEDVWLGEHGALAAAREDSCVIESSTVSPGWIDLWHRAAGEHQVLSVDAPLTGSLPRAREGTLIAFMAGSPDAVGAARVPFAAFCETILPFGTAGAAMRYKLVHNMLAAITLAGLAEAVVLAEQFGLPREQVENTLGRYGWGAPVASSKIGAMYDSNYAEHMCSLQLLAKDLKYAIGASRTPLSVSLAAHRQFDEAEDRGFGTADMAAVREAYP